jgi:hypothetical protein
MSNRDSKRVGKLARLKHASLFYSKKDLNDLLAINEKLDFFEISCGACYIKLFTVVTNKVLY